MDRNTKQGTRCLHPTIPTSSRPGGTDPEPRPGAGVPAAGEQQRAEARSQRNPALSEHGGVRRRCVARRLRARSELLLDVAGNMLLDVAFLPCCSCYFYRCGSRCLCVCECVSYSCQCRRSLSCQSCVVTVFHCRRYCYNTSHSFLGGLHHFPIWNRPPKQIFSRSLRGGGRHLTMCIIVCKDPAFLLL